MSAGVDQKPKSQRAQVQNGPVNPKDGVSDEDFERYMHTNQANQGYTAPNMAPAQDYMPSYYPSYSFQYSMPGSETTWSTGGDFNNFNYGYDNSYPAENYYNQPGTTPPYLNQGLNFFPGNADFMTGSWGNNSAPGPQGQQQQQQQVTSRSQQAAQGTSYYDYARYPNASQQPVAPGGQRGYQGINGLDGHDGKAHGMKAVEQGMSGLNIGAAGDKQTGIGGVMTQNAHGIRSEQDMVRGQQATTSTMAQQAPPPAVSAPVTAAKPQSWAAIASKPAKPQPKLKTKTGSHAPVPTQLPPMKQTMTIGTWNGSDKQGPKPATTSAAPAVQPQIQQPPHSQAPSQGQGQGGQAMKHQDHGQGEQSGPPAQQQQQHQHQQHQQNRASSQQQQRNHGGNPPSQHQQIQQRWSSSGNQGSSNSYASRSGGSGGNPTSTGSGTSGLSSISVNQAVGGSSAQQSSQPSPVLDKLRSANTYNPGTFTLDIKNSRMFIIKSYSEDDIHRSIKYGIWCSTEHGNKRLDSAFRERANKGPIYLLYSVNGSGHFCGVAEMMSVVDYNVNTGVWMQDKWKGRFDVRWIYVKDVPNSQLRHIRLENNDNKPVTNSRDTQEVSLDKGRQVVKIIHAYRHTTSIFDDFGHYEKRQEEDTARKPSGRDRRNQHRN